MATEQIATASPAPADTPSTSTSDAMEIIPESALGNDQYSVEYTTSAYLTDTLPSYAVGGRPSTLSNPGIPASRVNRTVTAAPRRNAYLPLAIVLLVGVVAVGLVVATHAHKKSHDTVNVSSNTDQANLEAGSLQPLERDTTANQKAAKSAARLSKLASTVNQDQKLPRMVEDYMQEMGTKGTDGVFQYRYRMVKVVAKDFNNESFLASQKLAAIKTQCGEPEGTGNLVKQGVVVRYTYLDKLNAQISSFDITSDDCP